MSDPGPLKGAEDHKHTLCSYCIREGIPLGMIEPTHFHKNVEILYGLEGRFLVWINGKEYLLSSGDLIIIYSEEIHQIKSLTDFRGSYGELCFQPEMVYCHVFHSYLETEYALTFLLKNTVCPKKIPKELISQTRIPNLLVEIGQELEDKNFAYEMAVQNHIEKIFLWILRYQYRKVKGSVSYPLEEGMTQRLQPVLEYINKHYMENLKVSDMAGLCGMSVSYFSRIFNRQIKINLNEYINRVRIVEAEKLLVSTEMKITKIAAVVGFTTTSYFIKLFRQYKGMTPLQYRQYK